jgi:hypothetical protein
MFKGLCPYSIQIFTRKIIPTYHRISKELYIEKIIRYSYAKTIKHIELLIFIIINDFQFQINIVFPV